MKLNPRSRTIRSVTLAALAAPILAAVPAAQADAGLAPQCSAVHVISTPPDTNSPFGITSGPGGVWVATGSHIDLMAHGQITQFALPDPDTANAGWLMWDGSSSYIWFADRGNGRIGTIDTEGSITEYQIPAGDAGTAVPQAVVLDGNQVWFTDGANSRIGSLDMSSGTFDLFATPTKNSGLVGMTLGRDGDLYFVERTKAKIGRFDPATQRFTEWSLAKGAFPNRILVDHAGNVWFTELTAAETGRIDTHGHLSETPEPGGPVGIILHGRSLYAADYSAGTLSQIDLSGQVVRTWDLPGAQGVLQLTARGHHVFVADGFADQVFRVDLTC